MLHCLRTSEAWIGFETVAGLFGTSAEKARSAGEVCARRSGKQRECHIEVKRCKDHDRLHES